MAFVKKESELILPEKMEARLQDRSVNIFDNNTVYITAFGNLQSR